MSVLCSAQNHEIPMLFAEQIDENLFDVLKLWDNISNCNAISSCHIMSFDDSISFVMKLRILFFVLNSSSYPSSSVNILALSRLCFARFLIRKDTKLFVETLISLYEHHESMISLCFKKHADFSKALSDGYSVILNTPIDWTFWRQISDITGLHIAMLYFTDFESNRID